MNILKYILGIVVLAIFHQCNAIDFLRLTLGDNGMVVPVSATGAINKSIDLGNTRSERNAYIAYIPDSPVKVGTLDSTDFHLVELFMKRGDELESIPSMVHCLFIRFISSGQLEVLARRTRAKNIVARFDVPLVLRGPLWEQAEIIAISSSECFSFADPDKLQLKKLYTSQPNVPGVPETKTKLDRLFESPESYKANLKKEVERLQNRQNELTEEILCC